MDIFSRKSTISLTCPKRITPFLKEEVKALGYPIKRTRKAGLETEGTLKDSMELVLSLRTAHRVHYLVDEFRAGDADEMYKKANAIHWENYIEPSGYVSITSFIDNPTIDNTQFANLRCKDAVVDRIRTKKGSRPDSGPSLDHTVLFLFWRNTNCRIFIDASGESLSRRGYRSESHSAPLQETLAASIIKATEWDGSGHFINPMCGSGTLAIEAAMAGLNRPAGSLRPNFGIKHVKGFADQSWEQLRSKLNQQRKKDFPGKIIATDRDPYAIQAAKKNAKTAGVDHLIQFEVCDFQETPLPPGNGVVVLNPPYGERLGEKEELESLYSSIGDFFKNKCTDYTGYVFTGNLDLAKKVGLRASRRFPFFNSTIDCRLLKYELYDGSRE
ncbi:MAG: class I SAM-dependent RNA methyltransferase [Balneolaceae bacterium]|nr:class I SAM-dependent RNA methyltransferase [Balneolaceae bacterium]